MKNINLSDLFKREMRIEDLDNSVAHPVHYVRDWKILVTVFAVGLLTLSFFSWRIYLSNQIAAGYLAPVLEETALSRKIIDIKKLQADLLIMEDKQTDFLKQKADRSKMVDPSI